jgi:hypothetical protein
MKERLIIGHGNRPAGENESKEREKRIKQELSYVHNAFAARWLVSDRGPLILQSGGDNLGFSNTKNSRIIVD